MTWVRSLARDLFFMSLCFDLKWPYIMFRDWPCVALNPCRSAAFYDEIIKWYVFYELVYSGEGR